MRPKRLDIDLANADLTGFLSNATGTSGALTATSSGDSLAHLVSLRNDSGNSKTGINFTFTGTDADGKVQTETRGGPGGTSTVQTTKYFLTLITVTWDATLGGDTVDIGWVDEATTQTIVLDHYSDNAPTAQVLVTGTINFDIETTLENPIKRIGGNDPEDTAPFTFTDQEDLAWLNDGNFTTKTDSLVAQLSNPGNRAMRIVVNSYSSGAELQVWITQPTGNR